MNDTDPSVDEAVAHERPEFAQAIKSIVRADPSELRQILSEHPQLIKERSQSDHRATLLHYLTSNAIEDALQLSSQSIYVVLQRCSQQERVNAVKRVLSVAQVLIDSGAEIDVQADAYDGGSLQTPLNWLVSSGHPAAAGVMSELTELLCQAGANVNGLQNDSSPVITALAFGHTQAAEVLFRHGASIDNLLLAAASGDLARVQGYRQEDGFRSGETERCRMAWFAPPEDSRQVAELALVFAAMCGHDDIVRYMIEAGVDRNAMPPGTHMTAAPLHTACLAEQASTVNLLIKLGCDPTLKDPRYEGDALDWAKHGGDKRIIQQVGHYLPEFMRQRESSSPAVQAFIEAIKANDPAELQRVLQTHVLAPEQLDGPWFAFDAPAVVACKSNMAVVDALVDAGANINQKSRWWAGGFGVLDDTEPELAEQLIARGAELDVWSAAGLDKLNKLQAMVIDEPSLVHARGPDGKTPLHCAKSVSAAKFLLSKGAAIDAKCVDHESTPAQYLVVDHPDVVRALIQHGCDADIMLAAALGDIPLAERILQEDPDAVTSAVDSEHFPSSAADCIYCWTLAWYVTPHQVARKLGHEECVQFLLQRSPPATKLVNACLLEDSAMMQELLDEMPNLAEQLSDSQRRQLAHAARNNEIHQVRRLLAAGIPVDTLGQHGATPLHWAAFHGNANMTDLLLQHQPSLEIEDADFGCTPMQWALHGCLQGWVADAGDFGSVISSLKAAGSRIDPSWPPTGKADIDALLAS